jgi:hypothetical protein
VADTFKAGIAARLGWKWVSEGVEDNDKIEHDTQLLTGFNWNQAQAVWAAKSVVLADAASVTYDLTNLSRTIFGTPFVVTMVDVRAIIIDNETEEEGTLIVGNAASNVWAPMFGADAHTIKVEPASAFINTNELDGWDVTATSKLLKLTASGGETTFSIAIIGATSAGASGSGSGP